MKLDIRTIKEITRGTVNISETEEGIRFFRFSDEEFALYENNPRLKRLKGTAGIHMEFDTDAEALSMKVITEQATNREFYSFDIFVDGEIIGHIKNFDEKDLCGRYDDVKGTLGENSGEFILGTGKKRVKIIFPWSAIGIVKEIELRGASFVTPVEKEKKLLAYGDSITQGYDARYPSNSYAEKLAEALGAELFNKGIAGEVHYPELAAIKSGFTPDYITVAFGTNDWSSLKKSDFESRCKNFWEALSRTYPGIKKFAITPIWRADIDNGEYGFKEFSDVEAFIRKTVEKYSDVVCISGFDFVPKETGFFSDLRLHPNDEGFDIYFENLYAEISKHI